MTARTSGVRFALIVGLLVTAAMTAVGGWFGWQTYQAHQRTATRELLVATARQGAVNLTSIDYSKADADVKRILDSATGKFYDEFSQRSKAFVDVVRQAQSKSEGKVTAAGIESSGANDARVLVAVTVTTSNVAAQQQPTRNWRMRIDVQKTGSGAKVSNVEFVP
ncbi:mammalian cell entry protein [Mycobacterium palustre]|uniref:Mammalian cell entry protein n=1 Tax=Mycobacterium palustre TaxID=153971 RepID=A0A1X1Z8T2_9MYCO|nr:mammalian cell entry protein [Mycobacterium palustre]